MTQKAAKPEVEKTLAEVPPTAGERFVGMVEREFLAEMGKGAQFTALERRLTQHMYLAVDQALKAAEEKRTKGWTEAKLATAADDPRAFTWHHIDRQQLAMDTVHRVSLGLDALVPNHMWPIAYFNSAKGKYDIDLRIGYIGRDYVTRRFALDIPLDISYELVFSTDQFKALPRSSSREVEGYEFEITSPFDRGDIVGGFGYIVYDDPRKNRLVLVTQRDFKRASNASKSDFWTKNNVEMHLKTVYHRTAAKIALDPAKVNAKVIADVLRDDTDPVDVAHREVDVAAARTANKQLVDAQPQKFPTVTVEAERVPVASRAKEEQDPEQADLDLEPDPGGDVAVPF